MSTERDALIAALVDEYVAILAHDGPWGEFGYQPTKGAYRLGGREALERVARRLGVLTVHDQAADRVARGGGAEQDSRPRFERRCRSCGHTVASTQCPVAPFDAGCPRCGAPTQLVACVGGQQP